MIILAVMCAGYWGPGARVSSYVLALYACSGVCVSDPLPESIADPVMLGPSQGRQCLRCTQYT